MKEKVNRCDQRSERSVDDATPSRAEFSGESERVFPESVVKEVLYLHNKFTGGAWCHPTEFHWDGRVSLSIEWANLGIILTNGTVDDETNHQRLGELFEDLEALGVVKSLAIGPHFNPACPDAGVTLHLHWHEHWEWN